MLIDSFIELRSGYDSPVMPRADYALTFEQREVFFQFVAECFVFVGVRKKEASH